MIFLTAQAGDPVANEIVGISADCLGLGLSTLIHILNPEGIVKGNIYSRNESLFKPLTEKVLPHESISSTLEVCHIKPVELGDSIGDYGNLCAASYETQFKNNGKGK